MQRNPDGTLAKLANPELATPVAPRQQIRAPLTQTRSPAMRLLDRYLQLAAQSGASDLHLESCTSELELPSTIEDGDPGGQSREIAIELRVRIRVDGRLRDLEPPPPSLAAPLLTRLRLMARVDLSERRLPQDGRFSFEHGRQPVDVRAAFVPVHRGEKVALRFLRQSEQALALEKLGFDTSQLAAVIAAITTAGGLTIIAGPTGSGKTTSAYAAINRMHDPSLAIVTAEDPVERTLAGVAQIAINEECGRTFSRVLRGILRLDPDVVMIGEIRDEESAQIACRAALTGHRVVTTLHASDTREAWIRMIDIGVPEALLAATTKLIVAQRLLRRVCPHCRKTRPTKEFDRNVFVSAGLQTPESFATQAGCDRCDQTGYAGRFPVFEIFDHLETPGTALGSASPADSLLRQALERVKQRDTTFEEAISQCPLPSPNGPVATS